MICAIICVSFKDEDSRCENCCAFTFYPTSNSLSTSRKSTVLSIIDEWTKNVQHFSGYFPIVQVEVIIKIYTLGSGQQMSEINIRNLILF